MNQIKHKINSSIASIDQYIDQLFDLYNIEAIDEVVLMDLVETDLEIKLGE